MFIGGWPTVQLQDFRMAKDLFNRSPNTITMTNTTCTAFVRANADASEQPSLFVHSSHRARVNWEGANLIGEAPGV